jgi:transposase
LQSHDSAAISPHQKPKKKPTFDPNENHGRYAASEYTGCPVVPITHESLKPGDCCPDCKSASLHGTLYALLPAVIVLLVGSPLITGTRYEVEKLRCSLCGHQFAAKTPKDIANQPK